MNESDSRHLLTVDGLAVEFPTEQGSVRVVDDVSFAIDRRESVGLIGESGCGKSVTSHAILGLVEHGGGRIASGSVVFDGRELVAMPTAEMNQLRASSISMIFQEPMTCLDPAFTIGQQIGEVLRWHRGLSRRRARAETIDLLDRVGIPEPGQRVDEYPHRLSGGMRQRALIAQAISCRPSLLIADEPTTALDVTVQAQVLELLRDLQEEFHMAILFVTHDLGVVSEFCDRVITMYAGQIVEAAPVPAIFETPRHPYTSALLECLPDLRPFEPLRSIPGAVPAPTEIPIGCRYSPRCRYKTETCEQFPVELLSIEASRLARCCRVAEVELEGVPING